MIILDHKLEDIMTLLITYMIIAGFGFHWTLYILAFVLWILHLIIHSNI